MLLTLLAPQHLIVWLVAAATALSIACVLYLMGFSPWLVTTRLDGRDGRVFVLMKQLVNPMSVRTHAGR